MGLLLWLVKPLFYVALLWIFAARFRKQFPGKIAAPPLVGILGAIARTGIGAVMAYGLVLLADKPAIFYPVFFLAGFVAWIVVTAIAYRGVPFGRVLVVAVIGEAISGSIDYWAWHDAQNIRFC